MEVAFSCGVFVVLLLKLYVYRVCDFTTGFIFLYRMRDHPAN